MVLYMLLDTMLQNSSGYFHIRIKCSIEHSFFLFFFLLSRHTVITWQNHKLIITENQLNSSVIKSNFKKISHCEFILTLMQELDLMM